MKKILITILAIDLLVIVISVSAGIYLKGMKYPSYFMGESGLVTYISFLQLLATGIIALMIYLIRSKKSLIKIKLFNIPGYFIWLIIFAGFLYLSLDEVLGIHDTLDKLIMGFISAMNISFLSTRDDISVFLYAVIGIITLILFYKELIDFKSSLILLSVGFIFVFASVAMDIASHKAKIIVDSFNLDYPMMQISRWIRAFEESFKVIAGAFFLGAFLKCHELAKTVEQFDGKKI